MKARNRLARGKSDSTMIAITGHSFFDAGQVSFWAKTTGCLLKPHSPLPVEALGLINLQSV